MSKAYWTHYNHWRCLRWIQFTDVHSVSVQRVSDRGY